MPAAPEIQETSFEITGHGRTIFCEQLTPGPVAFKTALILPGAGYSVDRPLLYFTTDLLLARAYQVILIHTNYSRFPTYRATTESHARHAIINDETARIAATLDERGIKPSIIVGKSIGTRAMRHLVPHFTSPKNIWLTPVIENDWSFLAGQEKNNLIIIGTADPLYPSMQSKLPKTSYVVPDADHSLEIPGDMQKTIATLGPIMGRIQAFLD